MADILFPGCTTLKDRRGHLRSMIARLRNAGFSAAQTGPADIPGRAWIAAACACSSESAAGRLLEEAGRILDDPSWTLSSVKSRLFVFDPEG